MERWGERAWGRWGGSDFGVKYRGWGLEEKGMGGGLEGVERVMGCFSGDTGWGFGGGM